MKYDQKHLEQLWLLFLSNRATKSQVEELLKAVKDPQGGIDNDWLYKHFPETDISMSDRPTPNRELDAILQIMALQDTDLQRSLYNPVDSDSAFSQLPVHRFGFQRKWALAAASIILIAGISVVIYLSSNRHTQSSLAMAKTSTDIKPGKDGAILTLSNGRQVMLDSLGNGVIALQNGSKAVLQNGQLTYDLFGTGSDEIVYNTISTPNGRQFRLVLPDGTKVWLNAASSLKYPVTFSGKERHVEISGEAYFEVTTIISMPFKVTVDKQAELEVLGTSFNINAYDNENIISTTLVEGSVRVRSVNDPPIGPVAGAQNNKAETMADHQQASPGIILRPGQQAQMVNMHVGEQPRALQNNPSFKTGVKRIDNADLDKVLAWKNGIFNFNDDSLADVMKQLARWYDIDVVYEKEVPDIQFLGKMSRDVNLTELLKGLEMSGVHFRIEDERKLVVMP